MSYIFQLYLDTECPLDAEREREDTDLDRDLDSERRDDFALGDLLLNNFIRINSVAFWSLESLQ